MSKLSPEDLDRLRGFIGPDALQPEAGEYQRPKQNGPTVETTRLLTPAEVAQVFRVDPKTVTRWNRAGKLPAVKTPGGHRRYRAEDVQAIATGNWEPS